MAEDDWDGWKMLTDETRRQGASSSATTCSSPTPSVCQDGIEQGRRQLHPDQGQPDRHADRDAGRHRDGAQGGYTAVIIASLRRDRGRDHRRHRRRHQRRPDQDRLAQPHRPDRQVQPAPANRRAARLGRALRRQGGAAQAVVRPSSAAIAGEVASAPPHSLFACLPVPRPRRRWLRRRPLLECVRFVVWSCGAFGPSVPPSTAARGDATS